MRESGSDVAQLRVAYDLLTAMQARAAAPGVWERCWVAATGHVQDASLSSTWQWQYALALLRSTAAQGEDAVIISYIAGLVLQVLQFATPLGPGVAASDAVRVLQFARGYCAQHIAQAVAEALA